MHSIGGVQSVKKHVQQGTDKRAAGELEGARPASNTINRRPKVLIHQRLLEQSSILIISKCSADEACQEKSSQDFFDKLAPPMHSIGVLLISSWLLFSV